MTACAVLLAAAALILVLPRPLPLPTQERRGRTRRPSPPGLLAAVAGVGLGALGLVAAGSMGVLVGAALTPVVLVLLHRHAAAPLRQADDPRLPLLLDLAAAAMRAGQPCAVALSLAARAVGGTCAPVLLQVAALLRLGAPPADAWRTAAEHDLLTEVSRAATRSADSGIRLAATFETAATDSRDRADALGRARAQRVGIAALAPLGACFLPAFVCVGIAPVILGIARTVLPGLH